ncbi:MAG: phosphotransferase family protein [Dehalococcoidia bacterium]
MKDLWFDTGRFEKWLGQHLAHGGKAPKVLGVRRIPGGFSAETYHVAVAWPGSVDGMPEELILRRDPAGGPVERDIEREYGVMLALRDSPIPVPKVFKLEKDSTRLERPFFVEEFLPGNADRHRLFSDAYAPMRPRLGERFIAILAAMHTLDARRWGLDFLGDPGGGTRPAAREVALWEDVEERNRLAPCPILTEAFIWLKANLPEAPRVSLVHGEFRAGNFLHDGDQIVAILDWEYAHLGDPVEDLGWAFRKAFRLGPNETGFFPRQEFLARYEAKAGFTVQPEALRFWEVLGYVKAIAILMTWQQAFRQKKLNYANLPGTNMRHACAAVARLLGL